jgi:hypothetical protein
MSLRVEPDLLRRAEQGPVTPGELADCVRTSLPYAYRMIADLAGRLEGTAADFVDNQTPPPDEQARGQLLRAMASDAIRGALEERFGVKLAFQNCHRVAAFRPERAGGRRHREFVSARGQILNQHPELVDC